MQINKEQFCEIIKRLRDYDDLQYKIQELFEDNIDSQEMGGINAGSICVSHETIVVKLLETMFNDTDTIRWWLYKCDYGRTIKAEDIIENNQKINLTTPEKLYDYLLENLKG